LKKKILFSTTRVPREKRLEEKNLTWEWQQHGLGGGACKGEAKGSDLPSVLAASRGGMQLRG